MFRRSSTGLLGATLITATLVMPSWATSDSPPLVSWGFNGSGALGDGSTDSSTAPIAVETLGVLQGKLITDIASGSEHSCAVANGKAYCWGNNYRGQLGDGTTDDSLVPVAVATSGTPLEGKTVTAITAHHIHTCAIADGEAYCWGFNGAGQLGDGTTTKSSVPVAVKTSGVLQGKTLSSISAGTAHTCAVADGAAYCWGYNGLEGRLGNGSLVTISEEPVAVDMSGALSGTATSISAGYTHSCAIADEGLACWGENSLGQLGDGNNTDSRVPTAVDDSGSFARATTSHVTAGQYFTCAVDKGAAFCWGMNNQGQLGTGDKANSLVPKPVLNTGALNAKTVTAVAAGYYHACAVADLQAACWGLNNAGQLGNASTVDSVEPVAVDTTGVMAGTGVLSIAVGEAHAVARLAFVPHAPTAVTGSAGNASATVSWTPPADDGGVPVQDFTVTAAPGGATCTTASTSCDVSGLANGTAHTFTVTARNAVGEGPASEPSDPVTPRTTPGSPTAVAGVPGDTQVQASWTPPDADGGSPILDYTVTATPGGATCATDGTSCVVAGLTNGIAYTFTVTARNGVGLSAPSAPSAPVTPQVAVSQQPLPVPHPGKVAGIKAKKSRGSLKITWKATTGADSYRLRISKPGGTRYKAWKTTSKRVFKTKVKKGKKYRFQIAAVGAGGRGPVTTIRFKGK